MAVTGKSEMTHLLCLVNGVARAKKPMMKLFSAFKILLSCLFHINDESTPHMKKRHNRCWQRKMNFLWAFFLARVIFPLSLCQQRQSLKFRARPEERSIYELNFSAIEFSFYFGLPSSCLARRLIQFTSQVIVDFISTDLFGKRNG